MAAASAPVARITHEPPVPAIVLVQFRPAWDLQAYLRFARLPYTVLDSRYASTAATGELPQLRHDRALVNGRHALAYLAQARAPLDRWPSEVADRAAGCCRRL
jgi:hypothetical protein